jgi:hypothetical protein
MTFERKHPRAVHKCKTERNVYSWPNIEKQVAKTVAKYSTSAWYKNWPPHASDITGENISITSLVKFYGMDAWVFRLPRRCWLHWIRWPNYIKDFSPCQILVYISNRGKVQTPKSLALAMTIRQMFSCSGLIFKILSGFGHCLLLSSTMSYDSAIAQATTNTSTLFQ